MAPISVVIPSRNEPYLSHTIKSVLEKSTGDIEVIAVLDGYWPEPQEYVENNRVSYLHTTDVRGMRGAINAGVRVARNPVILKLDAHILLSQGFDETLVKNLDKDWIVVPRRYALDVKRWDIEHRTDMKYPIDYMYLTRDLHGEVWKERDKERKDIPIDDLMSSQGSAWMMYKEWYDYLELLDDTSYGTFWSEFQEIGLKGWLSGGRIIVNKNAWYAHWHKTKGRGYTLPEGEKEQTQAMVERWKRGRVFHKQVYNLDWLIKKFAPVPGWEEYAGL